MQLTGILQINGHEVPLSEPPYVAIYDLASLVEHSCFPNLSKSFTKKGDVIFWAAVDIKKGTNLSICYSDALWGTASRQNHLLETKLFKCECVRCKDVTELGTKYSAIKCNRNDCPGLALPLSLEQWSGDWRYVLAVALIWNSFEIMEPFQVWFLPACFGQIIHKRYSWSRRNRSFCYEEKFHWRLLQVS